MSKRTRSGNIDDLFSGLRVAPKKKNTNYPFASAAAKTFAMNNNIDPSRITNRNGTNNTIMKADVEAYINKSKDKVRKTVNKELARREPDMRKLIRDLNNLKLAFK